MQLLTILSEPLGVALKILMATASVGSPILAYWAYKMAKDDGIAKQKDVDNLDKRMLDVETNKATTSYVDKLNRGTHKRIDVMEHRTDENITEIRRMLTEIHMIFIKNNTSPK